MAIQVAIEGYDSLEQIGVGGMAAVYRARKISIDKTVAIKVLFPYLATDESYIERFQREAKAAASIQHENIVNVIDFGDSDGAFYIVMEYYDGRTLEQLMKERPGLPPEIAIQILLEVAYGLEAAHALDIVHRDIKPANLIYTNQGGIKIADFGLARKSDSMTMITQHGKVIGTPAYMSPEQAAGRAVGPASDIFSFGVVAYELLGRRKPFEGRSYSDVLDKIQTHDPPPVTIANPLVLPEFEQIVQRALAKDERHRYARATELIADLEAAMEKNRITRDRRRLASYAKDPDQYDATFAEETITHCLSRGAFFMQKGNTHLKDAVLEYRRVLFLDPNHERARAHLSKCGSEAEPVRPQSVDAKLPADGEMTREVPAAGRSPRPKAPAPLRRGLAWAYSGIAAVVIVGALFAFRMLSPSGDASKDASVMPTGQRALERDSLGALATDSLPAARRIDDARQADSGKNTMRASTVEASVVPLPDRSDTTEKRAVAKETTGTKPAEPAVQKPAPKPNESAKVAPDLSHSTEPAPAPGWMSVYFLGGVGELWVDGKLFARQPPFERASIAAGTHRIECRMSGETSKQSLSVTIRSNHETVIEYEVGRVPVIADE